MAQPLDVVRQVAAEHGFEVVGVTSAEPLRDALVKLTAWCEAGYAAGMRYMDRNPPERADPTTLLETVKSVVTVAVNYWVPSPHFAADGRFGRVARYAWGRDYHDVVLPRLEACAEALKRRLGAKKAACACDHSPFLERAAAAQAGLGFFGKNTCLLLPKQGSWYFLGEVLLDVEIPPTIPDGTDHCGTCKDCLVACPTEAFDEPYVLDARRCISYLTIEHKGFIPRDLRGLMGAWVFGCDDCQDICPFNRYAQPTTWPQLGPEAGVGPRLDLVRTLSIDTDAAFKKRFQDTPLLRPKRRGLLRNAAVVARNVGATATVHALAARVEDDPEPLVRGHALWALFGLDPDRARRLADRLRTSDPDPLVRDEAEAGLAGQSRE